MRSSSTTVPKWPLSFLRTSICALALVAATFYDCSFFAPAHAANGSVAYTYDALGRVSTASYDTGVIVLYTYDANGNRTQQVIDVNTTGLTWTQTGLPCLTNCWGLSLWSGPQP